MDPSDKQKIELNEGYRVEADAEGLRVVVTDYHAPPLELPYRWIDELRSGAVAPRAQANEVLLLATDDRLGRSLVGGLSGCELTWVRSCGEARVLLGSCGYRLAILAALGISPIDAMAALPTSREVPALLLLSWRDPEVLRECAVRKIEVFTAPFETDSVQRAVRRLLDASAER